MSGSQWAEPASGEPSPGEQSWTLDAYAYQAPPPPRESRYPKSRLAHWGLRLASGLIDYVVIVWPVTLPTWLISDPHDRARWIALGIWPSLVFLLLVEYVEGRTGRSPGRALLGLRLVREETGQPLGFGRALGRRLLHILDSLPCYVGYLWPLWDHKRQTFADKCVGSVVLRRR